MKKYLSIFLFLSCFLTAATSVAQKRALGKPTAFERPVDTEGYAIQSPTKEKIKAPWIVICDREEAQTFGEVSKSGKLVNPKRKLKFKDWFYVSEESSDGNFIRIFKGNVNTATLKVEGAAKDYGWIHKKDILLWTSGMTDIRTKIDLKAFLLNRAEKVREIMKRDKKEIVDIFKGPETGEKIGEKTIYEFYFVFKKENGRYLLSKNVNINPEHNIEDLVGWVRFDRLEEWNTRICLEPNFESGAFEERKANPNFRMVAYVDETGAKSHNDTGQRDATKALWENDPVILKPNDLASDGKRFKGGVVRFPMLSNRVGNSYFRSGVIGELDIKYSDNSITEMSEIDWSLIMQAAQEKEVARRNFDILFVIEGTKSMSWFKEAINKLIDQASQEFVAVPNVRYGVAVYRDTPEKAEGKLFDVQKLQGSVDATKEFVAGVEFDRWHDNDNYTSMYYGVNQAMLEAGVNDRNTNVVFLIGSNGDLKSVRSRKGVDECFIKTGTVARKLADFNTHLISIQCKNAGREGASFVGNSRSLMLESANIQYSSYAGVSEVMPDLTVKNPELTDDNQLENGASFGAVYSPGSGRSFEEDELVAKGVAAAKSVYDFVEGFWNEINQIMEDGSSIETISAGKFAAAGAKFMSELVKKGGQKGLTSQELAKIAKDKYKLYTEVYIPKHIKGAKFDLYSQVLFMPENDLEDYIEVLDQLAIDLMKPEDDLREGLHRALITLVEKYTGNKKINKEFSTTELRAVMQGVEAEGIKTSKKRDFAIENVLSEKKMPYKDVREFAADMSSKSKKLKKILRKGKSHEFSYSSENNTYFWIPIEDTF